MRRTHRSRTYHCDTGPATVAGITVATTDDDDDTDMDSNSSSSSSTYSAGSIGACTQSSDASAKSSNVACDAPIATTCTATDVSSDMQGVRVYLSALAHVVAAAVQRTGQADPIAAAATAEVCEVPSRALQRLEGSGYSMPAVSALPECFLLAHWCLMGTPPPVQRPDRLGPWQYDISSMFIQPADIDEALHNALSVTPDPDRFIAHSAAAAVFLAFYCNKRASDLRAQRVSHCVLRDNGTVPAQMVERLVAVLQWLCTRARARRPLQADPRVFEHDPDTLCRELFAEYLPWTARKPVPSVEMVRFAGGLWRWGLTAPARDLAVRQFRPLERQAICLMTAPHA